ncbi:uncharacterized protein [Magallana gigas]|uniref:uncharacterized protein isoform X3 n=1 Tax=Magallana gigas TaxID=29159 RepID=UPI0033422567
MGCLAGFQQLPGSTDMVATCSNFQKVMTCLAPIKENCTSDENFQSSMTALNSVKSLCAGGGECTGPLQNCYKDAGIDTTGASMPEPSCEDAKTLQTCLKGLSTVCEGNYAYDQIKTSLQDVVAKCTNLASAQCDLQAAMGCLAGFQQLPGSTDMAATCSNFQKAMTCLAPIKENCNSDENFQSSMTALNSVESMCAGGGECTGPLQNCYKDAGIDTTGASMPEPSCEDAKTLQTCLKGLSTVCEGNYAYDQSKTSLQDVVAKCTNLASAQCDLQAAMGCLAGFQQLAGSTDMAATCSNFQKVMTCLAPIKENCNSDENFQSSMTALNSVESMCAGGGECTGPLQNCYKDAGIDTTGASMPEPSCEDAKTLQTCLKGLSTVCEGNYAYDQIKTSLQDVVSKCTSGGECTGSLQNCYKDAGIDITGASMPEPSCEDAKTLQTCLKGLSTVCEGNYAYDQIKTSLQDVVAICAGTQAFPSFVLILVAALMTFVKGF